MNQYRLTPEVMLLLGIAMSGAEALRLDPVGKDAGFPTERDIQEHDVSEFAKIRDPEYNVSEFARMIHQYTEYPQGWDPSSIRLCMEGKSLPVLYLLGAQKASTSSLAVDLINYLGIEGIQGKEFHFFDDVRGSRQTWLDTLPGCFSRKSILADMTPRNLRLSPLPPGIIPKGWWQELDVPQTLKQFYGGQLKQHVTFVVLLREPLSRFQSVFYHSKFHNFTCKRPGVWEELAAHSFTDIVHKSLANATNSTHASYNDGLWGSMYARHLESFLEVAPASRFVVAPMKKYSQDPSNFLQEIALRLGGIRPDIKVSIVPHVMNHTHPALDNDIDHEVRVSYEKFMSKENARLVSLLLKMQAEGAYLHGLPDGSIDETSVESWLTAWW